MDSGNDQAEESSRTSKATPFLADRSKERSGERDTAAAREREMSQVALVALAIAAVAVLASMFGRLPSPTWLTTLIGALVVIPLTIWRQRLSDRKRRLDHAVAFLGRAQRRLADIHEATGTVRAGEPNDRLPQSSGRGHVSHDYSADLDVFGEGSLFERTHDGLTANGKRRLAEILRGEHSAGPSDLQEAVRSLMNAWDFRERLSVEIAEIDHAAPRHSIARAELERRTAALPAWGLEEPAPPATAIAVAIDYSLSVIACASITGVALSQIPPIVAVIAYFVNLLWLGISTRDIDALTERFESMERTLVPWSKLFSVAESIPGDPAPISTARSKLRSDDGGAATAIRSLRSRVRRLTQRRNGAYALTVNVLFLLDAHARRSVQAWHRQYGARLTDWFDAAAEIEALASLAAYAAGAPEDTWPIFDPQGPRFSATGLAHPLLPRAHRVGNDCTLDREGTVWVVTGSNMSGKSTFLRAVGLSVVMARSGLPVAARALSLNVGGVVTSMRVEDSLQGGESRFLSEVRRLRQCVDAAHRPEGTLVLLDEILAGTNSKERHLGALAVLRSLGELPAIILLSTHDLGLAQIEDEAPDRTRIVHFRDRVERGEMIFDYVLRDGRLKTTNALRVMRREGLDVPDLPDDAL